MAEHGHVKVSRKFFESDPFWNEAREFSRSEAWLDLVQRAAWKEHKRFVQGGVVALGRGEVLASLRFLAEAWGWASPGKVKRFLSLLAEMGRISEQRTEQQGTVYLLVNYELYQSTPEETEQQTEQRQNTNGTPTEQREAVKAGKAKRGSSARPNRSTRLPDEWQPNEGHADRARSEGVDLRREALKFRNWAVGKGEARSNWDLTFTNWLLRAAEMGAKPATNGHRPDRPDFIIEKEAS